MTPTIPGPAAPGPLHRLPALAQRRAEAARSAAAHRQLVADARAVASDIPRDADAGYLVRAARRLLRRAAQDEFAREGVERVRLPDTVTRESLRTADVPGESSFHAFVADVLGGLDLTVSTLERDDALDLRDAPTSCDGYGLSLEVAADLASYLLGRAYALEDPEEDQTQFVERHEKVFRDDVREALRRQVTVPLELKAAQDRHELVEDGAHVAHGHPAGAGQTGDDATSSHHAPNVAQRAQTAYEFARSEAGRETLNMLRSGAAAAYGVYAQRAAKERGRSRRGGSDDRPHGS